jgi:hypothetical protein
MVMVIVIVMVIEMMMVMVIMMMVVVTITCGRSSMGGRTGWLRRSWPVLSSRNRSRVPPVCSV